MILIVFAILVIPVVAFMAFIGWAVESRTASPPEPEPGQFRDTPFRMP